MDSFKIKIADLVIEIDKEAQNIGFFDKYLVNNSENTDFIVKNNGFDEEYIDVHNQIAEKLPFYNGFLMHGAAISYENRAFIFIAPSGTGKTTHIGYWAKHIKDLVIINGDKPIIRQINGKNYVFGSPYSGKESQNNNISVPLEAIIILKRGKEDDIKEIDPKSYIDDILKQVYLPSNKEGLSLTINLINDIFKSIKTYELKCTNSDNAFYTCFNGLVNN